jgi:hypothetical protein
MTDRAGLKYALDQHVSGLVVYLGVCASHHPCHRHRAIRIG